MKRKLEGLRSLFPPLAISAVTLYLLDISWLRWGDPLRDVGREMYLPAALLSGRVLYRDIFYLYGPVSPWINALLYRLFGVSLWCLVADGVATLALTCWIMYVMARVFLDEFFAAWTVISFLLVCAFGHYLLPNIFTFILPYCYPAIHGTLFGLSGLYAFYRSLKTGRRGYALLAAMLSALTLLTKIEMGLALLAAILLALLVALRGRRLAPPRFKEMLALHLGLPLALAAPVYFFFLARSLTALGGSNLIGIVRSNLKASSFFTRWLIGLDIPGRNLLGLLYSLLFHLVPLALFVAAGYLAWRPKVRRLGLPPWLPPVLLAAAAGGATLLAGRLLPMREYQYRALPLWCLSALIWFAGVAWRRSGKQRDEALFMVALSAYALILLVRMLLNVWPGHYGFYLMAPAMIVYPVLFLGVIPRLAGGPREASLIKAGFLAMSLVLAWGHVELTRHNLALRTVEVATPRGALRFYDEPAARDIRDLIDYVSRETPPGSTLAVFPEGLTINFLADRENPLYHYSFLPIDFQDETFEDKIMADLRLNKVDFVALVERNADEYGQGEFGGTYGRRLMEDILSHYEVRHRFGQSAVLLGRKR